MISWSAPTNGADSYRIEASRDGGSYAEIASAVLSPQSYEAGAETTLGIRVVAIKTGVDQGFAQGEITLLPLPPALPTVTGADRRYGVEVVGVAFDLDSEPAAGLEFRAEMNHSNGDVVESGWTPSQFSPPARRAGDFVTQVPGPTGRWSAGSNRVRAQLRYRSATQRTRVGPWSAWLRAR